MPAASSRGRRSAAPEAPIPRVTARPRRAVTAPAAPTAATAAPSRPDALAPTAAALAAAAAAPPEDENEQRCPVCMEALKAKRRISLAPCKHEFHRTCALKWLETRCCTGAQQCPLCRAVVESVTTASQRTIPRVRAFGDSGQPTKRLVLACAHNRAQDTMVYLEAHHHQVKHTLAYLRGARARFVAGAVGVEASAAAVFLADVDEEVEKLVARARIYKEMKRAYRDGAMRASPAELNFIYDEPWDLATEMADLQRMQQIERDTREMTQEETRSQPPEDPFDRWPGMTGDWRATRILHLAGAAARAARSAAPRPVTPEPSARELRAAARASRAARREADEASS